MQSGLKGIAAPVGVGNQFFRPRRTGAKSRVAQEKLRDVCSILDFGGKADGITDNAPALRAAFASLSGTGGRIHFPGGVGKYVFRSSVTLTLPSGLFSIVITGDGADATVLNWPTTAGLVINCSNARHSVHVQDMTITTSAANAGSGLKLTNSVLLGVIMQSDVTRCTFRGDDGGAISNYWSIGVEVVGLSLISFCDVLSYGPGAQGIGVSLTGNAVTSPNYGIVYNFDRCTFLSHGVGVQYDSYIQGVSVSQCNFTNCTTGINVPAAAVGITQLAVTASQFDCTNVNIFVQSPIAGLMITNSLFYIASNGVGIVCSSTGFQCAITANVFSGEAASVNTIGISISGNITGSCVVGNTFYNLVTGTDLGGTATWLVDRNVYETTTTPIANSGTNRVGPDFVTGSGGAVTQLTSKNTTVTLNKRCGQITTNNAALGAGASVVFNLTNSTIAATDSIIVGIQGGGTANVYEVNVVAIAAGGCNMKLTNTSGGSLSESPVINYSVIKAVNS